jgi:uncharacterized DUF497 family protein
VRFEWDRANREHIARHGVSVGEVEQVIEEKPYHLSLDVRSAEIRVSVIGPTTTNRILFVAFTARGDRIRVVTARPANRKERRKYAEYLNPPKSRR